MNVETTPAPCLHCEAGGGAPCKTSTGLACERVHISRPGDVESYTTIEPTLTEALSRHATDIAKFMEEAAVKPGQECDWCKKKAVYERIIDGDTWYACPDHRKAKPPDAWR